MPREAPVTSAVLLSVLITLWYLLPAAAWRRRRLSVARHAHFRLTRGSALLAGRIVSGGCWRADRAVRQGARLKRPAMRAAPSRRRRPMTSGGPGGESPAARPRNGGGADGDRQGRRKNSGNTES